jgi:hypothetical protein
MVPPLSAKEKLQIQFRKRLRRGNTKNFELDPEFSEGVAAVMESEETAIVRVDSTKGQHYWFTDGCYPSTMIASANSSAINP